MLLKEEKAQQFLSRTNEATRLDVKSWELVSCCGINIHGVTTLSESHKQDGLDDTWGVAK
jgi:hypothetical protein